jgi:hypothetical protein
MLNSAVVGACIVLAASASALAAQVKLAGDARSGVGPVFEVWKFGNDGIPQPTIDGASTVRVTRVTQWSIPVSVTVPIGSRLSFDLTGAYASSDVQLSGTDPITGTDGYSLSGVSDVRVRATGHIVGDNVLVTAGINLPTGETELNEEELSALRVVGAPALSFQVPVLGVGAGGTLGVVLAREIGAWSWALGSSYEMRSQYTPISVAAGIPVDFSPGDAVRLSLGSSRLFGQHSMTFGLSADFFAKEELESGTSVGTAVGQSQLGPIYTADWQFDMASSRFRELTFYVVDRYRTEYEREGEKVSDSDANYLDAGVRSVTGLSPSTGLLVALNGRHQTGLESDNLLTTAAIASGSLTLGLQQRLGANYSLQPFVRVQGGRLKSGDASSTVTGFTGGLTLGARF